MSLLLNDERLTKRATEGDERAFAAIFDRYQEQLYRFCLSILGNPQDAQDALQNTMVKVLRGLPGEQRHIDLKPWLYRIAHNEAVELLRRRRPTTELDPELAGTGEGLAETAEQRQRLARLIADLGQLPERQRGALVMRELSDLDFEQIGGALGTSAATARQTVYEARLGLREMEAGREMSCLAVTKAVSDGDGRVLRRRDIRAHLRGCEECRSFREAIGARERDLAALAPLPAFVAAAMLKGLVGGNGAGATGATGAAGGGLGGSAGLGGGAAVKTVAASSLLKGIATVAVVAAVGATAADRGGLIDFAPGSSDGNAGAASTRSAPGPSSSAPAAASASSEKGTASGKAATRGATAGARGHGGSAENRAGNAAGGDPATGPGATAPNTTAPAATTPDSSTATGAIPSRPGKANTPPAASHGQETAASHKNTGKEVSAEAKGGNPSPPAHPEPPSHPEPPAGAGKPEAPPAGKPEAPPAAGKGQENAAEAKESHGKP